MEMNFVSELLIERNFDGVDAAGLAKKKEKLEAALQGYCTYLNRDVRDGDEKICIENPVNIPGSIKKEDLEGRPDTFYAGEMVVVGDKFFRFGGRHVEENSYVYENRGDVHDTYTGRWASSIDLPTEQSSVGGAECDWFIYLFGGSDGNSLSTVYKVDVDRGAIASVTPMDETDADIKAATITEKTDSSKAIYYAGWKGDIKRFDPAQLTHSDFMEKPSGGDDKAYCLVASNDGHDLFYMTKEALHRINVAEKTSTKVADFSYGLNYPGDTNCALATDGTFYLVQSFIDDDVTRGVFSIATESESSSDHIWYFNGDIPSHLSKVPSIAMVNDNLFISGYGYTDYFSTSGDAKLADDLLL